MSPKTKTDDTKRRDATRHGPTALRVACCCCCCKTLFRSLSFSESQHIQFLVQHTNTHTNGTASRNLAVHCVMTRGRGDILLHVSPMTLQTTFRRIRKEKRKEKKERKRERKRHFVMLAQCPTAKPATKKDEEEEEEEENFNISSSPFRSAQHNNKL